MDLGLGNLIELKRRLLAATMLSQTTYDGTITQIGRGVAGLFDKHCNRKFARLVDAVDQFSADRTSYIVERYPIEDIGLWQQRDDIATGFQEIDGEPTINRDESAGLLQFGDVLGSYLSQVRVTYTGGYWYDTTEDATGVKPAAATQLPHDVKEAWFLQCQEVWDKRDKLGISLIAKPEVESKIASMRFISSITDAPTVVQALLEKHRRFQIT